MKSAITTTATTTPRFTNTARWSASTTHTIKGINATTSRSRTGPDASLTRKHIAPMPRKRAADSAPIDPKLWSGSSGRSSLMLTWPIVIRSSNVAQPTLSFPSVNRSPLSR